MTGCMKEMMQASQSRIADGLAFGLLLFLFLFAASPARAQCETTTQVITAADVAIASHDATVTAQTAVIIAAVEAATNAARSVVVTEMNSSWDRLKARLNEFWEHWQEANKGQTAQLHAGLVDQTRAVSNNYDATNAGDAMRRIQRGEYKSRKEYMPTDEGCTFDSNARRLGRSLRVTEAVAAGGAETFRQLGGNREGTPAQFGSGAILKERTARYVGTFCDPATNGGASGCTTAGTLPRANVTPSTTLFGKDTLDMADPDTLLAVHELIYNLSGYEVGNPKDPTVLDKSAGREQRMEDRAVLAQMDAIGAVAWSVVGERTAGDNAPEIADLRTRIGITTPSANPSEYEIRQAIVEQLYDPRYYTNLQDTSSATVQKHIYLKAYSMLLLHKLIEKTEKIANVYAIQTANMLEQAASSRDGATESKRLRP